MTRSLRTSREKVLAVLRKDDRSMTPIEVAKATRLARENVRQFLDDMGW